MRTERRTISIFAIDIIVVLVDAPEDSDEWWMRKPLRPLQMEVFDD